MELSSFDSNKYHAIVRFKSTIPQKPAECPSDDRITASPRKINGEGEVVAYGLKQRQKRLCVEEIDSVIAAYKNGKSTYDLAKEYDCNRQTISSHLKRHGLSVDNTKTMIADNIPQIIDRTIR